MEEDISWKLRIEHKGFSHICMHWIHGFIHIDPSRETKEHCIILLLAPTPQRIVATAEMIQKGKKIVVVAAQEIIDWLSKFGSFEGYVDEYSQNGLHIALTPYEEFPAWRWPESLERLRAAIQSPIPVLKRVISKWKLPKSMPRVAKITFPSGATLVHLNLALHKDQDPNWIQAFATQCGEVNWILAGMDHHQSKAFSQNLSFFKSPLILVTDLLNDTRKAIGLPTQWLTPTVDELLNSFHQKSTKQMAFAFAPHASFRFNNINLMASQERK